MNPNAIDTRTVERYSGQPEDFDAWLTRLQVDAYGLNYLDILEGTERVGHGAIMTQADINAIGDANARAAEQAILDDHVKRNRGAFMFLLKALDNGTMMTVKNAVTGNALPARAAYVEMLRVLRDTSNISVMREIIALLELQSTGVDDAKETIRQQFTRYKRLEAAGLRLPEMLMNALLLFAMPQDLAPVRTKFLDTALTYAELRTQIELHITAEQTTPTATTAALTTREAEMLARIDELETRYKQLQDKDTRPRCKLPGHEKHAAEDCWTKYPEKMPESIRRRRGKRPPSGETTASLDDGYRWRPPGKPPG